MAWYDVPPLWAYTISIIWLDSGSRVMVPDLEACDTLPEALGTAAVSLAALY